MTVTNTYATVTDKQYAYAESLARKAGYRFVADAEKACFGKRKIGGLRRGDFSALISWLQDQLNA